MEEKTIYIAQSLRAKGIPLKVAFNLFDMGNNREIKHYDFKTFVLETLQVRFNEEELDRYYKMLPKPFNEDNFEVIFGKHLINPDYSEIKLQEN
jgi:hypothetical protein